MNTIAIGVAQIGQWYTNSETGDMFFVTGYDDKSHTIEIQSLDGNVSEIDEEAWSALPLEISEQPENYAEGVDLEIVDASESPHSPVGDLIAG